ncbi:MAG: hypothetical protein EBT92_18940 [Planctomycetes bacterium]|jgi:hypothetical protein|nr:hypothetical protein [Planctomycetota bacterium]
MKTSSFRELKVEERALLERLLSTDFPGKEELLVQIRHCLVRGIDEDGSLEFDVQTTVDVPNVKRGVLTEGEFYDTDGGIAHVLLHVVDGKVKELEFYKQDGSTVRGIPAPMNVEVFAQN